ncbi:MAG: hypothetical protein O8C66_09010 [Candidatus Methanoperedens sp.]|nr:hypothetical protein [Candidatus Methanoperedens sp.]MCZ7370636.1 hypothetical protein [Candidatus Methanoperedens sp.]
MRLLQFFLIMILMSGTAAANNAVITLGKTIDVPDRTVSFENQTFEITDIGNYRTNQDISFTVDAPGTDEMLVVLYDRDKISTWFKRFYNTSGRVVATIPGNKTSEAGTYVFAVSYQRNIIGAIPVVISDYDLSVSPKSRKVTAGKPLDVEVKINKNGVPVSVDGTVKVVLVRGSSSIDANATASGTGIYEAHINIPLPMNGTYSLYSAITTERKVYMNYPEMTGVENGGIVEILPPSAEKTPFLNGIVAMIILLAVVLLKRKKL